MEIVIREDAWHLGRKGAALAASTIRGEITERGCASIVLATGASQFAILQHLVEEDVDWTAVTMFHLDEYIGLAADHGASFCRYLRERFLEPIDYACKYHLVDGLADPTEECRRLSKLIDGHDIALALIGIGENGHLAFNDPPADFDVADPYIQVQLDAACRRQQLGEGWFATIDDVPRRAISMSISQIMRSRRLIVTVPDARKAEAVYRAVRGPVTPDCPASILQRHVDTVLYLDFESSKLIDAND